MTRDTIKRIDANLDSPIVRAASLPTEAEISQAEQEVGVPFPEDYREFLRRYGAAMVGSHPIFGLRPVEVMGDDYWSVVVVTRWYRSGRVPGTDEWVVVSDDHCGNPVGVDRDGTVWIHDHDFGGITHLEKNFEDYLRRWCLRAPRGKRHRPDR